MAKNLVQTKEFVKAKFDYGQEQSTSQQHYLRSQLSGIEAKQIYDEIINLPTTTATKGVTKQRVSKNNAKQIKTLNKNLNIFKLAQENNAVELKTLLEKGIDVNQVDEYGWSALMCAVCANAQDVVKLLLKYSANKFIKDKGGLDALALAEKIHNRDMINLLGSSKVNIVTTESKKIRKVLHLSFCKLCNESFSTTQEKHDSSTVHLLKVENSKTKTYYGIPEGNKGFQLLIRQGWDREHGLGPVGSGRKFPIKTKQKTDRSGIGALPENKIRKDNKAASVNQPPASSSKSSRSERLFERNFRREFL